MKVVKFCREERRRKSKPADISACMMSQTAGCHAPDDANTGLEPFKAGKCEA
jgi:hypothetical protein